jgi:PhnB protein
MGRVSTYLNFQGTTEEAFAFYAEVFGTSPASLQRFRDMPMLGTSDDDGDFILNMSLPIYAGHVLQGTDMLASRGQHVQIGNNTTIVLDVDTRDEADTYFAALSAGGDPVQCQPMFEVPWGYWGVCLDRFGIRWMFNCTNA